MSIVPRLDVYQMLMFARTLTYSESRTCMYIILFYIILSSGITITNALIFLYLPLNDKLKLSWNYYYYYYIILSSRTVA
jgi:hypothetical protein